MPETRTKWPFEGPLSVGVGILGAMDDSGLPELSRSGSVRPAGIRTTAELLAAGLTDDRVRALVKRGNLIPLGRGVYAEATAATRVRSSRNGERLLRIAAAVAIAGRDAVVSHRDAAIIHGLDLLDGPAMDHVTVSRPSNAARCRTERPGIRVCRSSLPADQVTVRRGIPVTSVARTVVDVARTTSFRSGVVTADSALRDRRTSRAEIGATLATCTRWPGVSRARRVTEFADGRSESPLESISRVAFDEGGLPAPDLQVWVGGDAGPVGRVDFLWREHRTVGEADGASKYADPGRARSQLRRDRALRDAGFEVVHFSWQEIMATPGQVVNALRVAFRRAAILRSSKQPPA